MSLLNTIKTDQMSARKERDKETASILTTLIGECTIIGKNDGGRETTDKEVQKVVKDFTKAINSNIEKLNSNDPRIDTFTQEKLILSKYLPIQLSEEQLTTEINNLVNEGFTNIGQVMKELKNRHSGNYDGKQAAKIIKEILA